MVSLFVFFFVMKKYVVVVKGFCFQNETKIKGPVSRIRDLRLAVMQISVFFLRLKGHKS